MYYAELGIDRYIRENFFPDVNYRGIFVDVGAGPPTFINNAKHFRETGWRTISVEPNPKFVEQHKTENSEVYEYACADFIGESNFTVNLNNDHWYTSENDGVSFSALDIRLDKYIAIPKHNTQYNLNVKVTTLNCILENCNVQNVDILAIDTEGWELDVLRGFDHKRYNPKIIILEVIGDSHTQDMYDSFMRERGYDRNSKFNYNAIYARDK